MAKAQKKKKAAAKPAAKKGATKKVAEKTPAKKEAAKKDAPTTAPEEKKDNHPEKPPKTGKPTMESMIVACQCGSTRYEVKKRTKTAISLVCAKCGLRASVKGNVAQVRVGKQEVLYALANTVITPDDTPDEAGDAPGEKVGDGTGGVGAQYVTLRFRIMKGDQKDVIDKAMEVIRIMQCGEDRFREQTWQGHALEWICADFLSGAPQDALQIFEACEAAEADAKRIAAQDSKPEPTARKIRDLRATVRDKLAYESGYLTADQVGADVKTLEIPGLDKDADSPQPPEEPDQDHDEDTNEEPEPVPDQGRLLRAVSATLEEYNTEAINAGLEGTDVPQFVVRDGSVPPTDLVEKWTGGGGYLIRILGDKRTIDANGDRAAVCAWISVEPAELALDFGMEYDDAVDDVLPNGEVEVVELLPPDYDEIDPWNQPHFADRREKL